MGAYGIPIRKTRLSNTKAFLRMNEKLGYTGIIDWMFSREVHDQTMDAVMEQALEEKDEFTRAVGPLMTGTPGAHAAIFGAIAHAQLPLGANTFQLIGQRPVEHTGFRAMTAQSSTAPPGIAENAGTGGVLVADYVPVTVPPKLIQHKFGVTHMFKNLEGKDDVLSSANKIELERQTFLNRVNRTVLRDVTQAYPERDDNVSSLHALVESYAHIDASAAVVANSADFYDVDRDAAASWADAVVNYNTANADTGRPLSRTFIDDAMMRADEFRLPPTSPYGGGIIITGGDTLMALDQLFDPHTRMMPEMVVGISLNGVNTAPGQQAGVRAHSYKGQPLFEDRVMPAPTPSGLSDMIGVDTSVTSMAMLSGVEMFTGSNPVNIDAHSDVYILRMMANVLVTLPGANYKITDIV